MCTFSLNQNASVHDGRKFTSKGALVSIKHHLGEGSTSAAKSLLINVVDVRADGDGNADWEGGVGAGPYRITSFNAGLGAELVKRDGWRGTGAWVDAVNLVAINDPNAR
ncbi:MAG: hypothetical protein AAF231_06190 [Pseudomonadota bacterium]